MLKKVFPYVAIAIMIIALVAYTASLPKAQDQAELVLKGEHTLRKAFSQSDTQSVSRSSFFLIMGSSTSRSKSVTTVKFAWLMNDKKAYAISSLPLEKIRVRFDDAAVNPTIKFRWSPTVNKEPELQELIDDYVIYALITVREEDWPTDVQLPLNEPREQ